MGLGVGIRSTMRIDGDVVAAVCNGISKRVSDGRGTFLWEDLWVGEVSLMQRFPRLYPISLQKRTLIADCGVWDGGTWQWSLLWRREFFGARITKPASASVAVGQIG